jgi:hypothetical protein
MTDITAAFIAQGYKASNAKQKGLFLPGGYYKYVI